MRWLSFPLAFLFAGVSTILGTASSALITVGSLDTPSHAYGVAVADNIAYVADASAGLRVIDVSNPASPVELGALALNTQGSARGLKSSES